MKGKILAVFVCFLLLCLTLNAQVNDLSVAPFNLGTTLQFKSNVLNEQRKLNVYLPEGYSDTSSIKYPVIYLLDGSADEDFIHIAGLVQFFNFPRVNVLKNAIVVGIVNVDRRRDYTYPTTIEKDKKDFPTTGGSVKFIRFLEREVKPLVNSRYHVSDESTIIGQSLGGLVATEILFQNPALFTKYIIVSPSLWWDNESLLKRTPAVLNNNQVSKPMVYLSSGSEGKKSANYMKALSQKLKDTHGDKMKFLNQHLTKEDHASILHIAVYNAMIWMK